MSKLQEPLQSFLVTIAVIEGKHYVWPEMTSFVQIKVDRQEKNSSVQFTTGCPYYNEYFVFEFFTTLNELVDKKVTLTVIRPGGILRKRQILGFITFDVGTVWYLPDHQCYHKWAILSAPAKDLVTGTRGYLKVDINVLTKGAFPRVPHDLLNDEIEGNLFLPDGVAVERQKVNFIFTVFRGEHLVKKNQIFESTFSKTDNPPATFIEIIFAGMTIKTSTKKSWNPVWNEKLILPELFAPLSQRFKLNLYTDGNKKNPSKYLNLRSIANGKEEGFLPTFGPSFIHFYAKNDLEGYLGKILISLQTQLISENVPAFPNVEIMPIISELPVKPMREEEFILHATIFDVSSILNKFNNKIISFRIACGPLVKEEYSMVTLSARPRNTNKNVCYLDMGGKKPCIFLNLTFPDVRKRIFLHNMLMKTADELKRRLNEIEDLFEVKPTKEARAQSDTMIVETLDFILTATVKYVDMASTFDLTEYTVLDQERLKLSLREMREIHARVTTCYCLKNKKNIFHRIEKTHQQLEILTEELDDWPNIYIWMIYGTKRVGYLIIPAKTVFYSPIPEEKGANCGVLQTVFLHESEPERKLRKKMKSIKFCAKMDLLVWMGAEKHWNEYFKCIPGGFTPEPEGPEAMPKWLIAQEKHEFQGLAFVFQGRISPGFDSNSLCDPYIHIIFGGVARQTQIFTNTLNPIWDQALIFPAVLYGTKEFIKANPPIILVEIYDQDTCNTSEMVGRSTVKPVIRLKDDVLPNAKLQWYPVENSFKLTAEILAAFELTEETDTELSSPRHHNTVVKIPQHIKPHLINHRIEVMFWGVRNLKKVQMLHINRPKIVLECVYTTLHSDPLQSAKKNLNFPSPVKIFETIIAQEIEYARCITMKMFDCRSFGISVYAGTHIAPMSNFFFQPLTREERQRKFEKWDQSKFDDSMSDTFESIISSLHCQELKKRHKSRGLTLEGLIKNCCKCFKRKKTVKIKYEEDNAYNEEKDFDWWTKYYASTNQFNQDSPSAFKYKLIIYDTELEAQPQFRGFNDMLMSFPMYKGKKTGDESLDDANTMGVFKGSLKIYQWPPVADYVTNSGLPLEKGVFQDFQPNNPLRYVLRVYCVRALNLRPKDNGKSDPYLFLTLNDKTINDKDNVVYKQLNPVFGRCFEFSGIFPEDHTLVIGVYDLDLWTNDDLIGETKIDVENRFYSLHRAHCGLAQDYKSEGHCEWRDYQKPASILLDLCRRWNLPDPEYTKTSVRIHGKDFTIKKFKPSADTDYDRQVLSLAALRRWQEVPVIGCPLVPEHVETRSLYHPYSPGLEQGKLQIWIDIFPVSDLPAPKAVNIEPRKPVDYELRVIVWNCQDIIMNEDDFFSGQQKSDVYVKGWLVSPQESQCTDVHYRSLSGEANFNWRFIFSFSYISTENKLVYRDENAFHFDSAEVKIPCAITFQVWDYDAFQIDDFLASLTLDLTHLPRSAHAPKLCKLSMLHPSAPTVNLFKIKRTRGWWPLRRYDETKKKQTLGGCIELEFELLLLEDAEKNPSGIGREAPQPLPPPNRPETSFSLFSNPFKTAKYLVKMNKWRIVKVLIILLLIFSTIASFVAFPSAIIHRILG